MTSFSSCVLSPVWVPPVAHVAKPVSRFLNLLNVSQFVPVKPDQRGKTSLVIRTPTKAFHGEEALLSAVTKHLIFCSAGMINRMR